MKPVVPLAKPYDLINKYILIREVKLGTSQVLITVNEAQVFQKKILAFVGFLSHHV